MDLEWAKDGVDDESLHRPGAARDRRLTAPINELEIYHLEGTQHDPGNRSLRRGSRIATGTGARREHPRRAPRRPARRRARRRNHQPRLGTRARSDRPPSSPTVAGARATLRSSRARSVSQRSSAPANATVAPSHRPGRHRVVRRRRCRRGARGQVPFSDRTNRRRRDPAATNEDPDQRRQSRHRVQDGGAPERRRRPGSDGVHHRRPHPSPSHGVAAPRARRRRARATQRSPDLVADYERPADFFVQQLSEGIATIAAAFYPKQVVVRLSDFKTNEYASLLGGRWFEPDRGQPDARLPRRASLRPPGLSRRLRAGVCRA